MSIVFFVFHFVLFVVFLQFIFFYGKFFFFQIPDFKNVYTEISFIRFFKKKRKKNALFCFVFLLIFIAQDMMVSCFAADVVVIEDIDIAFVVAFLRNHFNRPNQFLANFVENLVRDFFTELRSSFNLEHAKVLELLDVSLYIVGKRFTNTSVKWIVSVGSLCYLRRKKK